MARALICAAFSFGAATEVGAERLFIVQNGTSGEFQWQPDTGPTPPGALVHGIFSDSIASLGAAQLEVGTVVAGPDDATLFEASGFAEGVLTAGRALQMIHNVFTESGDVAPEVQQYLLENNAYMRQMAAFYGASDPYWGAVGLMMARARGLAAGIRQRLAERHIEDLIVEVPPPEALVQRRLQLISLSNDDFDAAILRVNLVVDIDEIARALNFTKSTLAEERSDLLLTAARDAQERMYKGHGHCSVLIKVLGERLLFGHNTWKPYNHMLRIWKDVSFAHAQSQAIANRRLRYTSYPGYYTSTDDWLVLPDTGLVVFETTDDAYDTERLGRYVSPRTITTPMRSMVASLLSETPREWYFTFSRENSGSQNNQWMILSTKAWQSRNAAATPRGIFYVLEQQPGLIVGKDMSETLLTDGFWSSFNQNRFEETLAASLSLDHLDSQCVCENQRGPLLAVAQEQMHSLADLQLVLTTNTWQTSELSWSCPKCSVASRFDVPGHNASIGAEMDPSSGSPACGRAGAFGALDAKVADDLMAAAGETLFVSGPPRIGVPAFDWATADGGMPPHKPVPPHFGHPSGPWQFPWLHLGEGIRDHPVVSSPGLRTQRAASSPEDVVANSLRQSSQAVPLVHYS